MRGLFLIGRMIVGLFFLMNAVQHFTRVGGMAQYAAAKGIPAPDLAVIASGVLLAVAGITFLLGIFPKVGVAAAALFLLPVTFLMHQFWTEPDPARAMIEMASFTKNLALLGATLMLVAIPEPWPLSVQGRRSMRLATTPAPA